MEILIETRTTHAHKKGKMNIAIVACIGVVLAVFGVGWFRQAGAGESAGAAEVRQLAAQLAAAHGRVRGAAASARVALGYNSNVDAVANATRVLTAVLAAAAAGERGGEPRDAPRIDSVRDLRRVFAHFFSRGAAAERFVEKTLFDKLVAQARADPAALLAPGGNAALMANALGRLGRAPLLGGVVGDTLRPLLHSRVRTVSTSTGANGAVNDEVHLILEYRRGERFEQWQVCFGETRFGVFVW